MDYQVTTEHVWVAPLPDRPGALAELLNKLTGAGVNLELILSRRDLPGRALLYVSPLRTIDEVRAAEAVGLTQDNSMRMLRVEGPNRVGLAVTIANSLGAAGINVSAYAAAALAGMHVTNLAFDDDADAEEARRILNTELAKLK